MKPFTKVIQWPESPAISDVKLRGKESHWDSIEAHYQSKRQSDYTRASVEAEKKVRQQLEEAHRDSALRIHGLVQSFQEAIPNAFQEMEQALTHMACTLTRKIIANVPIDANRMQAVISQALNELEHDSEMQIQIHPEDLALINTESGEDIAAELGHAGKIQFVENPKLTRGGCYLKTPFGDFDATMETKWKRIESLFQSETADSILTKSNHPTTET